MNLFSSKSKYNIGMTKEPAEAPIDLKAIYEKVKEKKKKQEEKEK